ncbi:MAG: nucleotide exchange factor GrpE [Gemmatimonadetes bacterium]|nr:nucleotide exchange factor GrpE [Gemmatimonadota bacterium]
MKKHVPDRAAAPGDDNEWPDDESGQQADAAEPTDADATSAGDGGVAAPDETGDDAPGDAIGGVAPDAVAEQEIATLAKEVGVQKDKYLRLLADYENFRKRSARERQEAESKGMGHLIKGILDTLDDLGRFAHLDPTSTDSKTVVEGVELVERKLLKSLAGHGLEVVNPVDELFDPTFQEALTTVPAATKGEDDFVAQVYQVGYVFNGLLLRPARVVVKQWQDGADAGTAS